MGNSINNQFKMRRHGGQADRATETSPSPYSMNQERTMANLGMAPTNYGTSDPGDKKTTGKPKKDDFRYESDAPGVTGTTYTKDTKEIASDYTRQGKPAQVGQKTSDSTFEPKDAPEVTNTFRDRSGQKKSGTTGTIEVNIRKGATRFS